MSENTSWLKKPEQLPYRRTLAPQNMTEINATLTMHPTESEKIIKPPKRKSCLLGRDRTKFQVTSDKKSRQSISGKPAFNRRTIMMVDGKQPVASSSSSIPSLHPPVRSGIPSRRANPSRPPMVRSTPLHMSTPCEQPRSILKAVAPRPVSAAKKVNFDNMPEEEDEGIFRLEESTIFTFSNLNLPKASSAVTKVDASTNTEVNAPQDTQTNQAQECQMQLLIKSVEQNILAAFAEKMALLEAKLENLEKSNSCACKSPLVPESALKPFHKFVANLDDIKEVSENVTPSIDEESRSVTPNIHSEQSELEVDTPKCSTLEVEKEPVPVVTQTQVLPEGESAQPLTPPQEPEDSLKTVDEVVKVEKEIQPASRVIEEGEIKMEFEPARRSARLHKVSSPTRALAPSQISLPVCPSAPSHKVSSPMPPPRDIAVIKPRQTRKRNIPRYLQSFELSPSAKTCKIEG